MSRLEQLKRHLKAGRVYRRQDLVKWSKSVDRHLDSLLRDGTLQKLSQGLYYYPKKTAFGNIPPEDGDLVASFLNDDRFLIMSLNAYNSLGVGTTQLYNNKIVYNHKRHGEYKLGNRAFEFRIKPHFPKKVTEEFLLVDLVNNLNSLAEDRDEILARVFRKASRMDETRLKKSVEDYGDVKTRKLLS
jgi:hypothetical protein